MAESDLTKPLASKNERSSLDANLNNLYEPLSRTLYLLRNPMIRASLAEQLGYKPDSQHVVISLLEDLLRTVTPLSSSLSKLGREAYQRPSSIADSEIFTELSYLTEQLNILKITMQSMQSDLSELGSRTP